MEHHDLSDCVLSKQMNMFYVGADGCKGGWFTVNLDDNNDWSVRVFKTIDELWQTYKHAKLILIDIPIGLRESGIGERVCDTEARKLLARKRGSSVFPVPCRPAVYARTDDAANRINKKLTDRGLSQQSLAIRSKIREVDELLSNKRAARSRIREIHPEVCFWALNGQQPMEHRKRKKIGYDERIELLRSVFPQTDDLVQYTRQKYRAELSLRQIARDDILDALVAAVTASKEKQGLSTIPEKPEIDSKRLPMEMLCFIRKPKRYTRELRTVAGMVASNHARQKILLGLKSETLNLGIKYQERLSDQLKK